MNLPSFSSTYLPARLAFFGSTNFGKTAIIFVPYLSQPAKLGKDGNHVIVTQVVPPDLTVSTSIGLTPLRWILR